MSGFLTFLFVLIYKLWTVGVGCSVGDSHLGWECRRPLVPDIEVTWLFSDFGVESIVDSSRMLSDLVYQCVGQTAGSV